MLWDRDQERCRGRQRRWGQRRGGSLVIEAVVAAALLATAAYGLTRLAKSAADLGGQSDQRLAATMAAENTLERLRGVPMETLIDQVGGVAEIVAESTRCEIEVSAERFETGGGDGIHLRVDVSPSKHIRVTLHDWRLPTKASEKEGAENTEAPDVPESSELPQDASPGEVNDA